AVYGNHDAGDVGVVDLHRVAVPEVRDESLPRSAKIDEHHEDWQSACPRRPDAQLAAAGAVSAVGGEEVVGAHIHAAAAVEVLDRRGHAVVVLAERQQRGAVADFAAAPASLVEQDWLQYALGTVFSE